MSALAFVPPRLASGHRLPPLVLVAVLAAAALAQDAPQSRPATQPAARAPIFAEVIEVHGDVRAAAAGSQTWQKVGLHDRFAAGTRLLTGIRSSVKLRVGQGEPYTCVLIDQVGLTVLSEAWRSRRLKRVRLGVGFGRVRAGVAEGGIESDFTIDCPVATLSKRGTWGIELYYERATDYFEVGLSDRGLLEVIDRLRAQRRLVQPHEVVNAAMRRWLDQAPLRFNVAVPDMLGQGQMQIAFHRSRVEGLGVLNPGAGRQNVLTLRRLIPPRTLLQALRRGQLPPAAAARFVPLRAEGFFGTGRGDELLGAILALPNP